MKVRDIAPTDFGGFIKREMRSCHVGADGCQVVSSHTEHEYHVMVPTIEEADGICIYCPKCLTEKGGTRGTHVVICWRPRVPLGIQPMPGRWEFAGTGLDDLSLVAGSSSILLVGGCNAHFFIEDGNVRMA